MKVFYKCESCEGEQTLQIRMDSNGDFTFPITVDCHLSCGGEFVARYTDSTPSSGGKAVHTVLDQSYPGGVRYLGMYSFGIDPI